VAADEAQVDQQIRNREKQVNDMIAKMQAEAIAKQKEEPRKKEEAKKKEEPQAAQQQKPSQKPTPGGSQKPTPGHTQKPKPPKNETPFVDQVSGFSYPLPSSYRRINSPYGTRTHPVTGKPNFHTGIDLPAPKNTRITAVKSGIVSISGYNASYGNYIVIQHTDGYSSLYGHMNSRAVGADDVVSQGQLIGYVGATGSATGNHLHLEIRKGGSRINPAGCFPGLS
ncbi:MAG: M23 family metallopeptidase, partial [Evtepia sp.]